MAFSFVFFFATQILMQLTAENVPKPATSDFVSDSSTPQTAIVDVGEGEEGSEPTREGVIGADQQQELASLFSGMAVSGEKAPRPMKPTQPVQPVRQAKARVQKQQSELEEQSAFGDLLGMVSVI